jgi:DNA-binding IclR family transcriptional regulator
MSKSSDQRPMQAFDAIEDDAGERRYRAPALEKGLDILELLARQGAAMTTTEISAALDRSVSELFRMVQVLQHRGYIEPSAAGDGWELSTKLFSLGMARAPMRTLLEASLPIMRELANELRQSCHLAVASDGLIVVVARVESPGYVGFSVRPGHRRHITETSSGAVLFAFQSAGEREAWLARIQDAPGGKAALKAFTDGAEAVRRRGYAHADSGYVQGVVDLSAPVIAGQGAVAALTVPYLHTSQSRTPVEEAGLRVRAAAKRISAELGGDAVTV